MPGFSQTPALILALPFALAASTAAHAQTAPSPSATIAVSNCNDSGPGSLRAAVASAASGDTINLRSLACRRLVLTSGAIQVPQNNLTLLGPTRAFTIDGNRASRVLAHTGTGTLRLRAMSIAFGRHAGSAVSGGCINSQGDLRLEYVRVHDCQLFENTGFAERGGGGMAGNNVALYDSEVSGNIAARDPACPNCSAIPLGGGILAINQLTLVRSRVIGNSSPQGYGGGFHVGDPFTDDGEGLHVRQSEISGNLADDSGAFSAGGQDLLVTDSLIADNVATTLTNVSMGGASILIANTTISGNISRGSISALNLTSPDMSIINSTIVNNVETLEYDRYGCWGPLFFDGELHLESTIIARNMCDGDRLDIYGNRQVSRIVGSDNLVMVSTLPLPSDTISANPRISPLADNGGRNRTHALWSGSPAVDMGNNNAGLEYDQRGPGFNRVNGVRADIGAYER